MANINNYASTSRLVQAKFMKCNKRLAMRCGCCQSVRVPVYSSEISQVHTEEDR